MKKIKRAKDLEEEKRKLQHSLKELETSIRGDWQNIRLAAHPQNIAKDIFSSWLDRESEEKKNKTNKSAGILSYIPSLLIRKLFRGRANK